MPIDNKPDGPLVALAESCVDFVHRSLTLPLDYTQDTLPILDHYLRSAGKDVREVALLSPIVAAAGAYFGTMICSLFPDARFVSGGDDYAKYRVEFGHIFLHFNPVGIAQEVIHGAEAEGFLAHFSTLDEHRKIIEQTLTQGLELKDQDYYSFSVRYEMLEQVIAVLVAIEEQRGGERRSFGPEVYAALLEDSPTTDLPTA